MQRPIQNLAARGKAQSNLGLGKEAILGEHCLDCLRQLCLGGKDDLIRRKVVRVEERVQGQGAQVRDKLRPLG